MAAYVLLSSYDTVQVFSPTLAAEAIYCTIKTAPSGSIVQYAVPKTSFDLDQGQALLESVAQAVENAISGGLAVAAYGSQTIDDSGLLQDVVVFTVEYSPPGGSVAPLTTTVEIPIWLLVADPAFAAFITGGSAQERLLAAYNRLVAIAGG